MSVSDAYMSRIRRRLAAYDRLPPELRAVVREAYSDRIDPEEIDEFASLPYYRTRTAQLVATTQAQDNALRAEADLGVPKEGTGRTPAQEAADRALRRRANHAYRYSRARMTAQQAADRAEGKGGC